MRHDSKHVRQLVGCVCIVLLHFITIGWMMSTEWTFVYHGALRPVSRDAPPAWMRSSSTIEHAGFTGTARELRLARGMVYLSPDAPMVSADSGWWIGRRYRFEDGRAPSIFQRYGLLAPTSGRSLQDGDWMSAPWIRLALPCWTMWLLTAVPTAYAWRREKGIQATPRRRGRQKNTVRLEHGWSTAIAGLVSLAMWLSMYFVVMKISNRTWGPRFPASLEFLEWAWLLAMMVLWLVMTGILFRSTYMLFRWRRVRELTPHCDCCGYNLTGNVSGVCPECGTPVQEHIRLSSRFGDLQSPFASTATATLTVLYAGPDWRKNCMAAHSGSISGPLRRTACGAGHSEYGQPLHTAACPPTRSESG